MKKQKLIKLIINCSVILLLVSCLNVASEIKNWVEAQNFEDIKGKFHHLGNDDIKVYLPEVFKKYSTVDYQELLDSLATKKDYEFEIKRLQHLREMEGNFYIFYDELTRSTYTINTMPYMPLSRQDAKFILGMFRVNNEKISDKTNLQFTKITAKYNESAGPQIFKVIYKIDNTKKQLTSYNTSYIVSSNNKTIYIQLLTGYDVDFDPYLQKMIM